MKIRNYTSSVPADRSILQIERLLADMGATHIGKVYDKGKPYGFNFQIPVNGQPLIFKLPCRVKEVGKILLKGRGFLVGKALENVEAQAERTAWKLMLDWVSVQTTMVFLQQTKAEEIFLPYLMNPDTGDTLFEQLEKGGFKMLGSGKEAK